MSHYYSEKQTSILKLSKIKSELRCGQFEFYTGSGVFSIGKVDKGSEILINNAVVKDGWKVLDMGCGYGAVGIVMAKCYPKCKVVMTDVNKRAVKLARMNAKLNNVDVEIKQGNLYEGVDEKFDAIIVNPPQKAGKDICFLIIEKAKKYLKKDGLLQVVARHQKGGKPLQAKMEEVFGNVKDLVKKSGYRVYISKN
jgi:16S rRNA G1207 methylase RsmC